MTEGQPDNIIEIRCADAVELVTDYFDDALSPTDLAIFEHHLTTCDGCTIFVDQLKMTVTLASHVGRQQIGIMPDNFDTLIELLTQDKP